MGWTPISGGGASIGSDDQTLIQLYSTPTLLAWWKCDEASGNLVDQVSGLVLTASGSPTYSSSLANGMTGVRINTSQTDYFTLNPQSFAPQGSHTLAIWFDDDGEGEQNSGFCAFSTDGANRLVYGHSTTQHIHFFDGNTRSVSGDVDLADDGAHFIVWRREGIDSTYLGYFDGSEGDVPNAGVTSKNLRSFSAFSLAGQLPSNPGVQGQYANVMIWDSVLPKQVLDALYNSGSGRNPITGAAF